MMHVLFFQQLDKIRYLEEKLREDIERQLDDIVQIEHQLTKNLVLIQGKKQQLEVRKRQPFQCLVNVVSCWKWHVTFHTTVVYCCLQ